MKVVRYDNNYSLTFIICDFILQTMSSETHIYIGIIYMFYVDNITYLIVFLVQSLP
jgi:hypothetical protein